MAFIDRCLQGWRVGDSNYYVIQVMTGVAWGQYQDYLDGRFDGQNHWDQAQTDRDGKPIMHGGFKDVPYMSPGGGLWPLSHGGHQAGTGCRRRGKLFGGA